MPGIHCGSCSNGPFKREFIEQGDYENNIRGGYWFCDWCVQYTDSGTHDTVSERLISRAKSNDARQPFPTHI
jgi:hypothetical protein